MIPGRTSSNDPVMVVIAAGVPILVPNRISPRSTAMGLTSTDRDGVQWLTVPLPSIAVSSLCIDCNRVNRTGLRGS